VEVSREWSLSVHDYSLFWNLGTDPMGSWPTKPKWKCDSFNFLNFIFGRAKYSTVTIEEREVGIPLPEKVYRAKVKMFWSFWKRPRWFTSKLQRVDLEVLDKGGVPVPGKGENSWDCGDDAVFGFCMPASNISEAVGEFVGNVLKTRVGYNGYESYDWTNQIRDPLKKFVSMGERK